VKIKTSLILALALAAGAAGAENWVPVGNSAISVDADEIMHKKLEDGKEVLVFQARLGDDAPKGVVIIVNCSGQDIAFVGKAGGEYPSVSQVWPAGSPGGDWRDKVCKPFMK
jgi:hypothetical protein